MRHFHRGISLSTATAMCAAVIAVSGCGGGGSSAPATPPDTTTAQNELNQGVRDPSTLTTTNLTNISNAFGTARSQDPGDLDAQAGFVISETALVGQTVTSSNGLQLANVRPRFAGPSSLQNSLDFWKLPSTFSTGSPLISPQDLIPHITTTQGTLTVAQEQTLARQLDTDLANVEQALGVIYQHPTYTYTLADPTQPSNTNATVKVGVDEFRAFGSVVALVRSILNISVAYDADPGNFNFNAPISTAWASYLNTTSNVPPSVYLPPSPFLTLNSDGRTRTQTTKSELGVAITDGTTALLDLQTRNSTGYLFNPTAYNITGQQLASYETNLAGYQAYLNGPVSVGSVTLNLEAFLNSPPSDLKALAPKITVTPLNGTMIDVQATSWPDPTFDGLLPGATTVTTASNSIDYSVPEATDAAVVGDALSSGFIFNYF